MTGPSQFILTFILVGLACSPAGWALFLWGVRRGRAAEQRGRAFRSAERLNIEITADTSAARAALAGLADQVDRVKRAQLEATAAVQRAREAVCEHMALVQAGHVERVSEVSAVIASPMFGRKHGTAERWDVCNCEECEEARPRVASAGE